MFEMINEEKPSPEARKLFVVKLAAFVLGIAAMGGIAYFIVMSYQK